MSFVWGKKLKTSDASYCEHYKNNFFQKHWLTWSVPPDWPSPFCSFLGSFSRMVKIQSSLPKSFPPDAWPSCSLIGPTFQKIYQYKQRVWSALKLKMKAELLFLAETSTHLRVRLIWTGLGSSGLLSLPPLVLVHQLRQVWRLLRMSDDQFMLQQFFGSRPLQKEQKKESEAMQSGEIRQNICRITLDYIQNWALCWGRPRQTPWEVCSSCPRVWAGCSLEWGITPSWDGGLSEAARLSPAR